MLKAVFISTVVTAVPIVPPQARFAITIDSKRVEPALWSVARDAPVPRESEPLALIAESVVPALFSQRVRCPDCPTAPRTISATLLACWFGMSTP